MATSWSFDSFLSMASKSFEIKKKVAFYERVKVIEIPSARILTRKEKKALWHPEPPEWKKGGSRIRQLMCAIDFDDDSDEGRDDDEEVDELGNKKRYPVSAVLDEQRNQRELGKEVDDEFIAKMYQRCSAHSLRRAQLRAVQDELDAREYLSHSWDRSSSRIRPLKMFRLSS